MTVRSGTNDVFGRCGLAILGGLAALILVSCGPGGDDELDVLLAEANRYLVNGFVDEAEPLLDRVLAADEQNAEARLQKMFCAHRRGAVGADALLDALNEIDPRRLPPGFDDLVRARILLLGDDRDTALRDTALRDSARNCFERAAARGVERIRQAVLHEVDFMREWAATRLFSVAARFPIIEEKGRALSRLTFRPLETSWLTAFVCTPGRNARLVFPRAGRKQALRPGDDEPCAGGGARLVEFFRDSGTWIYLPDEKKSFLCALATAGRPDRDRARAILLETLRGGGGGPECVAALEEAFGAGRALFVLPEPF